MSSGVWVKQGAVIPAVAADIPGQPTVLFETGAQILSGTVFKCWFGTENGVCYAESTDGLSWTRFVSNPIIVGGHTFPRLFKNGSTYYLYTSGLNGPIKVYTSTDGVTFNLQNAAAISAGAGGAWDNPRCCQLNIVTILNGTWYGYYTGAINENTLGWAMGLATSTDGINWAKGSNNPVITFEGPSNFFWATVGKVYYGWSQIVLPGIPGNSNKQLPSDIMRFYAFNPIGPWTPLNTPTMYRTVNAEGLVTGGSPFIVTGQVADPTMVQAGADLWMFYASVGGASPAISAAKAASTTIAQLVTGYEGVSNVPIPTVAGLALNLNQQASDAFTRANENPLAGNWTRLSTLSNFGTAQLISNGVQQTSTAGTTRASYWWNAQAWNADQWASAKVSACAGTSICGVALRCDTAGAASQYQCTWVAATGLGNSGACRIQKFVTGTSTVLASCTGITLNAGDTITGSVIGTQISHYINGVLMLTITDNSLATGAAGLQIFAASSLSDVIMTNWAGGNIVAPASIPTPTSSGGAGTNNDMLNVTRWCTRLWG